jgi:hypothetical protein
VARLVDDILDAGPHEVIWSGIEDSGTAVASGVYYVLVTGAGGADQGKVTLVK